MAETLRALFAVFAIGAFVGYVAGDIGRVNSETIAIAHTCGTDLTPNCERLISKLEFR